MSYYLIGDSGSVAFVPFSGVVQSEDATYTNKATSNPKRSRCGGAGKGIRFRIGRPGWRTESRPYRHGCKLRLDFL